MHVKTSVGLGCGITKFQAGPPHQASVHPQLHCTHVNSQLTKLFRYVFRNTKCVKSSANQALSPPFRQPANNVLESEPMGIDDTIAAISTANGSAAIAVVRMTGNDAFIIAAKVFSPGTRLEDTAENYSLKTFKSHLARHGYIKDPATGTVIDEVILIPYKAPRTYTGQDLVEINCHGGQLVSSEILNLLLAQGARLAERGEFTKRAFLSGRIDLTQAEAVADLIQSKTRCQGQMALSTLEGALGNQIRVLRQNLIDLMVRIVAGLDFPEEIGDMDLSDVERIVEFNLQKLQELSKTARSGRFLRDGTRLSIVGQPNAGKSSLLNQLLKFERAIVTPTAGTTRDSLEELLDLNGIPIILIDTAGIRPTSDEIERIGIDRTKQAISESDLVLWVEDLSNPDKLDDAQILELLQARPFIKVLNKVDLSSTKGQNTASEVYISAKTGMGMNDLSHTIEQWVLQGNNSTAPRLNQRQSELCLKASDSLQLVLETVKSGLPQDCLATDLKIAIDKLSEICGQSVSEEVIQQVFASFCIGK